MHRSRLIPIFLFTCLPLGCASWQSTDSKAVPPAAQTQHGETPPSQLVALDFVNTLQQIESLQPAQTTVHLLSTSRTDDFTLKMQIALQAAGYGIRWVSDDSSGQLFQYRHEQLAGDLAGHRETYEVAVGSVELRRSYYTDAQTGINPITPLYVRGVDASRIVLDDTHFVAATATASLTPAILSGPATPAVPSKPLINRARTPGSTLSVPDEANPLNPLISGANRKPALSLPLITLTREENVFELGASNFEDELASHRTVGELILTFPNDSLRLGEVNKRLMEQLLRSYQPESDVLSIIGCSLGPTQLKGGNAALALGRASRVREALLFAGIPQDSILDEGCWANDASNNPLPRRGVVLTLNRRV